MKRILEGLDTWTGRAIICFLGACLVIMSVFGGIALLAAQHVNVAQLCIEKGGSWVDDHDSKNLHDPKTDKTTDSGDVWTEHCTLPSKP